MSDPQVAQIVLSSGTILTLVGMAGTVSVLLVSIGLYVGRVQSKVDKMQLDLNNLGSGVRKLDSDIEALDDSTISVSDCGKEQRTWEVRVTGYLNEIKIRDENNKKEQDGIMQRLESNNELVLRLASENNDRYLAIEDYLKQLQKRC